MKNKISNPTVLPSEVTFRLNFCSDGNQETGIYCSYCNNVHYWSDIVGEEGPGELISFVAKKASSGISPNCAYSK